MASLHDDVQDGAISVITTNGDKLHICTDDPGVTWSNIASYSCGYKATPGYTGPSPGDVSGRKVQVDAISDGTVDCTGTVTASHWAIVDEGSTKILASGALASSQSVTDTNTFTLTAFDIEFPDPA